MSDKRQLEELDFTVQGSRLVNDVFVTDDEEVATVKNRP